MAIQKILNRELENSSDIIALLEISDLDDIELLYQKSAAVKQLFLGRTKNNILSIQFSNYCENSCLYCEMREDNDSIKRFRLSPDEVIEKIDSIFSNRITNIILQSGQDSYYDTDMISYLIYKIKENYNVEITLDLLQRDFSEYRAWKFSGADNYLLKFNTSNSKNFSLFTRDNLLDERIEHLTYLKRIGYKICTGNIVGLPHQTLEDLANDLLLLKKISPEMVLNTPFTPQTQTKYEDFPKGDFNLLLKSIAISRILLNKSNIIVAAASNYFTEYEKHRLFSIGADTIMYEALMNGKLNPIKYP